MLALLPLLEIQCFYVCWLTCWRLGAAPYTISFARTAPYTIAIWNSWDGIANLRQGHNRASVGLVGRADSGTKEHATTHEWSSALCLNAWKESKRRIFTGRRLTFVEVATLAREDIMQRGHAFAAYTQPIPAKPD